MGRARFNSSPKTFDGRADTLGRVLDSRRAVPIAGIIFGVLALVAGLSLIAIYVVDAVVTRVGEPDQSRVFWYLPLLFAGIMGTAIGGVAVLLSRQRLRKLASRHIEPADRADSGSRTLD